MPLIEADEILVRDARPRDRNSILAFTQHTFHWGDYLPRSWDHWLKDPRGKLLVAVVSGKTVGNLHVVFSGQREAWFEGMRVHRNYRKRGVAERLDTRARELSREAGCRVVRLETGAANLAAQSALASFGYRRVLSLVEWEAPSEKLGIENVRLALPRDIDNLKNLWEHSWMKRVTRSLSPLGDPWHWGKLGKARLLDGAKQSRIWVTPAAGRARGFAVVNEEEDAFEVVLVVGRAAAVGALLHACRGLANVRGHSKCYLVLPKRPRASARARANGFKSMNGGLLIYERIV